METEDTTVMASGFCQKALNLKITLGYSTNSAGGITLVAVEQRNAGVQQPWRKFQVSRENALKAAEELCADAAQYLDTVSQKWRPSEDLDFDDFQEHLRAFLDNSMH